MTQHSKKRPPPSPASTGERSYQRPKGTPEVITTDTIVGLPVSRPKVPAPDAMIPGLHPVLTGRATYVRRSWRTRATRFIQVNGWATAWGSAVCVVAGYVVEQALTGGIQ